MILFARLDRLLRSARPARGVLLALDGPAPLAKLLTQRARRRRAGRRESKGGGKGGLSSLALTPGTEFMARVEARDGFWASGRRALVCECSPCRAPPAWAEGPLCPATTPPGDPH